MYFIDLYDVLFILWIRLVNYKAAKRMALTTDSPTTALPVVYTSFNFRNFPLSHNKWRTPLSVWYDAVHASNNLIVNRVGELKWAPSKAVKKYEKSFGNRSAPAANVVATPDRAIPVSNNINVNDKFELVCCEFLPVIRWVMDSMLVNWGL